VLPTFCPEKFKTTGETVAVFGSFAVPFNTITCVVSELCNCNVAETEPGKFGVNETFTWQFAPGASEAPQLSCSVKSVVFVYGFGVTDKFNANAFVVEFVILTACVALCESNT
jgi:hypothetical protein